MDGHMNGLTDQEITAVREAARLSAAKAPAVGAKTAKQVGDLLNSVSSSAKVNGTSAAA